MSQTLDWELLKTNYTAAMDYDGSNNMIYFGVAKIGSSKSAAVWQIKRLIYAVSNLTDIQFADGDDKYDNVWNDRAGLSYL